MDDKNVIMMDATDDVGQVKIADDVIAIIAEIAAIEVEGVAGMGGTLTSDIMQTLSRKRTPKGVKVELDEGRVMLEMGLIINYGVKIPQVTREVQEKVKSSIELMTGLEIISINIHILGIHFDKEINNKDQELELED